MANPEHLAILDQGVEAWNTWREEHPDGFPDLSRANLSDADLREVNLNETDVSNSDLTGANLMEASLFVTDLAGSDLTGANLDAARIWGADLRRANLSEADLSVALLHDAELSGADLTRAILNGTILSALKLHYCVGLEKVRHLAPSQITLETLYLSKGALPEIFLRGVGLDEDFIQNTRGLFSRAIEFYSCFVSYSHGDRPFARRLHDQLQARGIRCWLDEHQVLPGDDLYEMVDRGIRLWDKVLLCCSEASLSSWWVEEEIEKAFRKEREIRKREGRKALALIPLNLDGSLFNWESGMASVVKKRLAADFTGWATDNDKFEQEFRKVVRALRADEAAREQPPEPRL